MHIQNPLVSVITPVYNSEKFIGETIESVIGQTYKNWEMIVIDDGSTDKTESIVRFYMSKDPRIKYFPLGYNSGRPAVPRNYGIKHAKGEYIAFLDSDDFWHKQKLEKQLPHFETLEIIGVASNAVSLSETPYYRKDNLARSNRGYVDYNYLDILNRNRIMTSSLIIRRDILDQSGLFDEDKSFSFIEDWELWLRMARYGSFRVLESPLLTYLVSRKRGYQSSVISKNCLKILKKQVDSGYVRYDDIIEPNALIHFAIARNLLEFDQEQSRKYYMQALKTSSNRSGKIKGCIGLLVSFLPGYLRKITLLILYKADWILCSIKEQLWKMSKSYYCDNRPTRN